MARPIQVLPRGLLGFLQLKNMGQNPSEFPDLLQPVLEMREWYYETNAITQVASGLALVPAATTVGNLILLVVPNGQAWAVLDADCILVTGAGQVIDYRIMFLDGPAPGGNASGLSGYVRQSGAGEANIANSMPRSYRIPILGPGYQVGIQIQEITAAAADFAGAFVLRTAVLPL